MSPVDKEDNSGPASCNRAASLASCARSCGPLSLLLAHGCQHLTAAKAPLSLERLKIQLHCSISTAFEKPPPPPSPCRLADSCCPPWHATRTHAPLPDSNNKHSALLPSDVTPFRMENLASIDLFRGIMTNDYSAESNRTDACLALCSAVSPRRAYWHVNPLNVIMNYVYSTAEADSRHSPGNPLQLHSTCAPGCVAALQGLG